MRSSQLFTRTSKEANKQETSRNAQLLSRAGYVSRLMAGVYQYLPLGLRTLNNIENIIRDEMNKIGGLEILMPTLHPRENWEKTGRWEKVDVLYTLSSDRTSQSAPHDLALAPTHEESVTPMIAGFVQSYRDLPIAAYQIQTKFRNEPRPKAGLMRGREFRMKDMYSFHVDQGDLDAFYERATQAYVNVYERCGLGNRTLITFASGGAFSKYSHEFQTISEYGEDVVYRLPGTKIAINKEVIDDKEALREIIPGYKDGDESKLEELKAIEVGNIFKLGTRFSEAFNAQFTDKDGTMKKMVMGCYGIGPSRLVGTIAECMSDDRGLVWPESVSPFKAGIINLKAGNEKTDKACEDMYAALQKSGADIFYDDRDESAGVKFADMDLLGFPWQIVAGPRGLEKGTVEVKNRASGEKQEMSIESAIAKLSGK
ncbi:MAG: His/Gly/Thr/Pro-type tRNA ligase C-terminal domain-containing protein [Alphaproteobacteria bacterium]|nr:His/Gly/Thr/Pro-type tRNA ligase C-terminal domain-containing protein [Alphaproteobacteria bacterium]